jgi:hypothetical protein
MDDVFLYSEASIDSLLTRNSSKVRIQGWFKKMNSYFRAQALPISLDFGKQAHMDYSVKYRPRSSILIICTKNCKKIKG